MKKLNESDFIDLEPRTLPYEVRAEVDLALRIFPNGSKTWVYIYFDQTIVQRETLGIYPEMSVEQAYVALEKARHEAFKSSEMATLKNIEQENPPTKSYTGRISAIAATMCAAALLLVYLPLNSDLALEQAIPLPMIETVAKIIDIPAPVVPQHEESAISGPPSIQPLIEEIATVDTLQPPVAEEVVIADAPQPPVAEEVAIADTPQPPVAEEVAIADTPQPPAAEEVAIADTPQPLTTEEIAVIDTPQPLTTEEVTTIGTLQPSTIEEEEAAIADTPLPSVVTEVTAVANTPPSPILEVEEIETPIIMATTETAMKSDLTQHSNGLVKRAQFTSGIQDREPIDQIDNLLNSVADEDSAKQLYFFTEVAKLEGRTIYHRWQLNGEVLAEIPFEVKSNWRWRVFSSKKILPSMQGEWRVSVIDDQGNTLYSEQFSTYPVGDMVNNNERVDESKQVALLQH